MAKEAKGLKVFVWSGFWRDHRNVHPDGEARFFMAALSKAEVLRTLGRSSLDNLSETVLADEVVAATARPLVVFARHGIDRNSGIHAVDITSVGVHI